MERSSRVATTVIPVLLDCLRAYRIMVYLSPIEISSRDISSSFTVNYPSSISIEDPDPALIKDLMDGFSRHRATHEEIYLTTMWNGSGDYGTAIMLQRGVMRICSSCVTALERVRHDLGEELGDS